MDHTTNPGTNGRPTLPLGHDPLNHLTFVYSGQWTKKTSLRILHPSWNSPLSHSPPTLHGSPQCKIKHSKRRKKNLKKFAQGKRPKSEVFFFQSTKIAKLQSAAAMKCVNKSETVHRWIKVNRGHKIGFLNVFFDSVSEKNTFFTVSEQRERSKTVR